MVGAEMCAQCRVRVAAPKLDPNSFYRIRQAWRAPKAKEPVVRYLYETDTLEWERGKWTTYDAKRAAELLREHPYAEAEKV